MFVPEGKGGSRCDPTLSATVLVSETLFYPEKAIINERSAEGFFDLRNGPVLCVAGQYVGA